MRVSDGVVLASLGLLLVWAMFVWRAVPERRRWLGVLARPAAAIPVLVLGASLLVALLDSLPAAGPHPAPIPARTVLDTLMADAALGDSSASSNPVASSLLAQSLKALRNMWLVGLGGITICLPLVLLVGIWAGRVRGMVDRCLQGACRAVEAIPAILLMLALMLVAQSGLERLQFQQAVSSVVVSDLRLLILCVVLAVPALPRLCLAIRDCCVVQMRGDAALGARGLGVGDARILVHQVLPVIAHVVVVTSFVGFPGLVLSEVVLSFLGAGLDAHARSAGTVLADALAIAVTDPAGWDVLIAALLPIGSMLAAAQALALAMRRLHLR